MRSIRAGLGIVVALAAAAGTTSCNGNCPPVECNIEGLPDLPDEALACASRAVDGTNGVAYWLMPLSPVIVSETGVLPYVLVSANTSDAAVPALLASATGEWFYEPEGGDPISIKAVEISVAPNIEAGPGQDEHFVGSVGLWGEGLPMLSELRWANLRFELRDGDRSATFRVRLPVRAERAAGLDADCWRAITMHRDRPIRNWSNAVISDLLRASESE